MNIDLTRFCACASAVCLSFAMPAQESEGGANAEANADAETLQQAPKPAGKHFHELVRLTVANDSVLVKLPTASDFVPAVEGKFYPNGSQFRVAGGQKDAAEFEFGKDSTMKVAGNTEFGMREVSFGTQARTVMLTRGAVTVSLPRTLPTGLFSVAYPNFIVKDMAGESRHELVKMGDGDEAVVHVITGMMALEGAQFNIVRMSAADRIRIRTTGDALFTSMRGEAGDYKVSLDQGVSVYRDPISGAVSNQCRRLDFSLTPQCAIKIFRKRSEVGGRMAVSVMTFDPAGEMRNRFTFAENAANINFGEEVVRIQDISFKTKSDAKKKGGKDNEKDSGQKGGSSGGGESDGSGNDSSSGSGESNAGGESSGSGDDASGSGGESNAGGFGF